MPGYKVFLEDGGEIREGLTCSYCKLVLKDPVQTSESGLRLCRGCFEAAKKLVAIDFLITGIILLVNVMCNINLYDYSIEHFMPYSSKFEIFSPYFHDSSIL